MVGYKKVLGGATTWPYLFMGNALPMLQILTMWSFPESPKWLVQKGRDSEARRALQRLRMTKDVRMDMFLMKGGMEAKGQNDGAEPLLKVTVGPNGGTVNEEPRNEKENVSGAT